MAIVWIAEMTEADMKRLTTTEEKFIRDVLENYDMISSKAAKKLLEEIDALRKELKTAEDNAYEAMSDRHNLLRSQD